MLVTRGNVVFLFWYWYLGGGSSSTPACRPFLVSCRFLIVFFHPLVLLSPKRFDLFILIPL